MTFPPGLYESLLTDSLAARLESLPDDRRPQMDGLRSAEAADRIAWHIASVVERAIDMLPEPQRAAVGAALARSLVDRVVEHTDVAELTDQRPHDPAGVLRAVHRLRPDGAPAAMDTPLIPLLDSALLTNSPGEPAVGHQVAAEMASSDRIDLIMAFIRRSGIRPLRDRLRSHVAAGKRLRVLTTTYTGSTEAAALDWLAELRADVRVSYDTASTRLHAKAWLFHRDSGFSTAYVGSSNLTHWAQATGLEWNVRISGARNRPIVEKVAAVFESYWEEADFEPYDPARFAVALANVRDRPERERLVLSPTEVRPYPFQERLLEQIELSPYTFAHALRDASFGELWVGGRRPEQYDHVFASIQSLNASGVDRLPPDHFDVVIIDEFHHAAAQSYRALLERLEPVELLVDRLRDVDGIRARLRAPCGVAPPRNSDAMPASARLAGGAHPRSRCSPNLGGGPLGLTATPERSDGLPVLHWFGDRIAAELRLWDAIDQHRLTPFAYYGIADALDLREIPWRRGRGYDEKALTHVITATDVWARYVLKQFAEHFGDPPDTRALGFCVGVDHARYMARVFNQHGVPAVAVTGETDDAARKRALRDLERGDVRVVFSVDLFNEGVDVPTVDALLMLRPTESPLLFLQQLGRGLRKAEGKAVCTVLDFVGHHRQEFRYDRRFRALLGGTRTDVARQVEQGFPFLPAGCHMELDRIASERVLASIRNALPRTIAERAQELAELVASQGDVTLKQFLGATGLDLDDLYAGHYSWSDLRERAGLDTAAAGHHEAVLRRACGRLLHVDDPERLGMWRRWLQRDTPPDVAGADVSARGDRLLRMLLGQLLDQVADKDMTLREGADVLWAHPQVRRELDELFEVLEDRVTHLTPDLGILPDVPLHVHARYTRIEILAACGVGDGARVMPWQTGVLYMEALPADLLAFTLDKTRGAFSPTTRYRDYAISRDLIHWENQSVTRADSETGRRYQEHAKRGSHVLLFARLNTDERAFHFLGPARYVRHESEQPMAITWKLEYRLPGDLYQGFAAAVA